MVGKLGLFGAILFVGSGLLAAWVGLHMLFAHPLGFCGTAMVFFVWACFARLLVFVLTVGAPLKEYRGEEADVFVPLPPAGFSPKAPENRVLPGTEPEMAGNRILGSQNRESGTPGRTRLRLTQDPPESEEAAERRENAAWAEMFRAL